MVIHLFVTSFEGHQWLDESGGLGDCHQFSYWLYPRWIWERSLFKYKLLSRVCTFPCNRKSDLADHHYIDHIAFQMNRNWNNGRYKLEILFLHN